MADSKTDALAPEAPGSPPAAPARSGGGLMAWVPLIATIVVMPALAYATTTFYIVPHIQRAVGAAPADAATPAAPKGGGHAEAGGHAGSGESGKQTFSLNKLIVNVAGTMGTRYLMTSLTIAGKAPDFQARLVEHKDQLMDLAAGTLSTKTISDLEKPEARDHVRAELLTAFNGALGENTVQEIYITEFAIQ